MDRTADEVRQNHFSTASWDRDELTLQLKGAEDIYTRPEGALETAVLCRHTNDINTQLNISDGART